MTSAWSRSSWFWEKQPAEASRQKTVDSRQERVVISDFLERAAWCFCCICASSALSVYCRLSTVYYLLLLTTTYGDLLPQRAAIGRQVLRGVALGHCHQEGVGQFRVPAAQWQPAQDAMPPQPDQHCIYP